MLRGAAAIAVGGVGLGAGADRASAKSDADNAEAPADYPGVSTRDHFDDDCNLVDGQTGYSYDYRGDWSGIAGDRELTLFVHGWNNDDDANDDIDSAYECQLALERNGYGGDVAVFTWDSDKGDSWWDAGWTDAKCIANRNGEKLANFVTDWNDEVGTDVRLIAHSLGARVVGDALRSLVEDFGATNAVRSVSLLGGAIDDQSPGWDYEFGPYVADGAVRVDNFWNRDDEVLDNIYSAREWDTAVGQRGLEDGVSAPGNYQDVGVSDVVDAHGDYYKREVGCIPQVVAEF